MKALKKTVKYQIERDGETIGGVFDRKYDAENTGKILINCGFIKEYRVVPIKASWLTVK
jgi:hypothetical protein